MASSVNNWKGIRSLAEKAGATYPELVAAQWAVESGWGKHFSGRSNPFGLKGEGSHHLTQEVVNGKTITITASFIDFPDLGTAVTFLVDRWYKDWKGYKGVNNAASREAAAHALVEGQYATDPEYAEKLIELMDKQEPKGGSQAVSKESKPQGGVKSLLFKIEANQDTWLKKEPKQAGGLGEKQKVAAVKDKVYAVVAYQEQAADAHARVELGDGAGTWFIYEPHWKKVQSSGEAMPASVDWSDFGCLVTPHLTVGEILQWDKRRIPGPNASVRTRLVRTAEEFQKVRDAWGRPLGVTSFYRPEPINAECGGVPGSKHVTGEAFDVYPTDRSLESFYQWIRLRWTGGLGDGRTKGFIHLDTRGGGGFVPGAGMRPAAEWLY